jgi:hypothetical protein
LDSQCEEGGDEGEAGKRGYRAFGAEPEIGNEVGGRGSIRVTSCTFAAKIGAF